MKKLFTIAIVFGVVFLLSTAVFAQQRRTESVDTIQQINQINNEPGNDLEEPALVETRRVDGKDTQTQTQARQTIHEPITGLSDPDLRESAKTKIQLKQGTQSERAINRRSQIANAVQEMVRVAERNGGIGKQIRTIAQNQNQLQEQAEGALASAQNRSRFTRFFIGPNYGHLKDAEERLKLHNEKLEELKGLVDGVSAIDRDLLEEQIGTMELIAVELATEIEEDASGFSIFGWLNRFLSK